MNRLSYLILARGWPNKRLWFPPDLPMRPLFWGPLAYSHVDMAVPIRTVNIGSGWTMMDFHPEDVSAIWPNSKETLVE